MSLMTTQHATGSFYFVFETLDTDGPNLPDDVMNSSVEGRATEQQFSRLERVTAVGSRIEFEVGEHVILSGHARKHSGLVAFLASNREGSMGWGDEYTGMTVEDAENGLSEADVSQHHLYSDMISNMFTVAKNLVPQTSGHRFRIYSCLDHTARSGQRKAH